MRPPICGYCHKSNREDEIKCKLVTFAVTAEEKAINDRMIANHMVGHKKGLEWFCQEHLEIAKKYTHLTLREAMKQIHGEIGRQS